MKKSEPTPDLAQAFSSLKTHEAVVVPDNPDVEADAEVRSYLMFQDVARLYCTASGDGRSTLPKTYLSSGDKWGPYHISMLPYDKNDAGFDLESEEEEVAFDPDIYDGLRRLVADLSLKATPDSEVVEREGIHVFTCDTIESLLQSCYNMLKDEECPGGMFERTRLCNGIEKIVRAVAVEKAQDGIPYPAFRWHNH